MGWEDLFVSRSSRTFHVNDSPDVARRVVNNMTVEDGAPDGLPPGVIARRTGRGHFNAVSPFAGFDSQFEVRSDGRGGSYVTEHKMAGNPIPVVGRIVGGLANVIHDNKTHPQDAYWSARRRR
jgi:hypothetical protein